MFYTYIHIYIFIYYLILRTQKINFVTKPIVSSLFDLVAVLLILEKHSALYWKGQKNMPKEIIIRKNKAPFMNTCWHVDITIMSVDLFIVDNNSFNLNKFIICQIRNNRTVIDKVNHWNILHFKEAYMIKHIDHP